MPEDARLRKLACCASEPPCVLCPLLPANEGLTLKQLATLGLKANLDHVLPLDQD
jgi:hypothetical protein